MNALSLPVDIPWKRLCVSSDMIDKNVCDRKFPYRWRSSVTLFSYQPPEEHQTYEGMTISYLRVACTITGFQENPNEVGLNDGKAKSYWNDAKVIENYIDKVSKYYACNGALLEVAVAPSEAGIALSKYPYFADFDPKKRELFEVVTTTGDVMSRTQEEINVRKGLTTSESHEEVDNTSIGAKASGGIGFASVSAEFNKSWGTKDVSQQQTENVKTTDDAREQRESSLSLRNLLRCIINLTAIIWGRIVQSFSCFRVHIL